MMRKRALVVDDDEPIRRMLTKIVERLDLDVDEARDGAEAIERIDADGYSVILLDLMMPRVDGFGVLSHMEREHPEDVPRTIIATAVPPHELSKRLDAPVRSVHAKPFDIEKLMNDIRELMA